MNTCTRFLALAVAVVSLTAVPPALADTVLRVFAGGPQQRTDLARKMFDEYEKNHPGVKIQLESGGATSEL